MVKNQRQGAFFLSLFLSEIHRYAPLAPDEIPLSGGVKAVGMLLLCLLQFGAVDGGK